MLCNPRPESELERIGETMSIHEAINKIRWFLQDGSDTPTYEDMQEILALLEAEPHREASQTGEPMEFTEKSRGRIARDLAILAAPQELISKTTTRVIAQEALEHLAEACDIIDRLTAENERLKKPASRCNCGYC